MLVDFCVKNYRSYRDEVVLSMETGKNLRKLSKENTFQIKGTKLVKSAFILGANASGKTNILKALQLLKFLVLNNTTNSQSALPHEPYGRNKLPTGFEIRFIKNDILFEYKISYSSTEIFKESLYANNKVIFYRTKNEDELIVPDTIKNYVSTLLHNQTLLYMAQSLNHREAKIAFSWFVNLVDMTDLLDAERIFNDIDCEILSNTKVKEKVLAILKASDFSIKDYIFYKDRDIKNVILKGISDALSNDEPFQPEDRQRFLNIVKDNVENTKKLLLIHEAEDGEFPLSLSAESTGTVKFIQILFHILEEFSSGKVILIDEVENSMHIELLQIVVGLMNKWNKSNQFIVTTHVYELIDFNMRVDQIYFANKNMHGISELYSLYDFQDSSKIRRDFSYKTRYLKGRFGGIPIIDYSLLDSILGEVNGEKEES